MTKRYFYTDPLAAAWMLKHFEMKFQRRQGVGYRNLLYPELLSCAHMKRSTEYFIHHNSLHLLEPKAGDTAKVRWLPGEPDSEIVVFSIHIDNTAHDVMQIIQRKGVAFHWPQSEEA